MRICLSVCVILGQVAGAQAGEFTPIGESGGFYSFTECVAPVEPDVAIDPSLKGRRQTRAFNRKLKAYNAYVGEANAYLQCLSDEAGRDLQTYYNAVTATFETRQSKTIAGIEAMRRALALDEATAPLDLEGALDGGRGG